MHIQQAWHTEVNCKQTWSHCSQAHISQKYVPLEFDLGSIHAHAIHTGLQQPHTRGASHRYR